MDILRQILAVCSWNLRSIASRAAASIVAVVGFFAVVLVFVGVLSVRDGLMRGLNSADSDSVAIVYSPTGRLDGSALNAIAQAPGVAQSSRGPLVSGTFATNVEIPKWAPNLLAVAFMRGVDARYTAVMPHFRIVRGRMFRRGLNEVIVGQSAEQLYSGLSIGGSLSWNRRDWKVVGVFATSNGLRDSMLLADVNQIQGANALGNVYSAVFVRLTSPDMFPAFKTALQHNPQLSAIPEPLDKYDAEFGQSLNTLLLSADAIITVLMAIGAVFGSLNIMYANVANRMPEIAILRTLGFGHIPVLVAIFSEALLLALIGGSLGLAAAYFTLNGVEATTSVRDTLVGFKLVLTFAAVELSFALVLIMSLLGGMLPAIRAARTPIAQALRAL